MSWKKDYFISEEFECHCGCRLGSERDEIDSDHLERLNMARHYAGIPFKITSGCRCEKHNKDVGGSDNSDHLPRPQCAGSDIECTSSRERYRIIKALLWAGFNRIGIGEDFIHAGNREDNPKDVIWIYS